jgi:radical SAM protein with 4Fe4S-binding SPASM domain
MKNLERVAAATTARGGVPLVIPRLLKVRDTIPEMESFFDFWIERTGWAVIDYPTDRAGEISFAGVVDMTPPKRRPCRRIWDRMLIHANGRAVACDQDAHAKLPAGHIEQHTLSEMWQQMNGLRQQHAAGKWNDISPCNTCKEWHRA